MTWGMQLVQLWPAATEALQSGTHSKMVEQAPNWPRHKPQCSCMHPASHVQSMLSRIATSAELQSV